MAEFKDNVWRRLSDLKQPRSRHRSIMLGTQAIIIGGITSEENSMGTIETEVWDFKTGENRTIEPTLSQNEYSQGIALDFIGIPKEGYCGLDKDGVPING